MQHSHDHDDQEEELPTNHVGTPPAFPSARDRARRQRAESRIPGLSPVDQACRDRARCAAQRAAFYGKELERAAAERRELETAFFSFQIAPHFYLEEKRARSAKSSRPASAAAPAYRGAPVLQSSHPSVAASSRPESGRIRYTRPVGGGGGPRSSAGRTDGYSSARQGIVVCDMPRRRSIQVERAEVAAERETGPEVNYRTKTFGGYYGPAWREPVESMTPDHQMAWTPSSPRYRSRRFGHVKGHNTGVQQQAVTSTVQRAPISTPDRVEWDGTPGGAGRRPWVD